jgi:hypothetical protein
MPHDPERIESLKAGTLAAVSVFLAYGIATLGNNLVRAKLVETQISSLLQVQVGAHLLVSGAIAWLSGFLFGVTYRYVIREDSNPHLKTGAVLAFGLVRGLAQVEVGLNFPNAFWSFAVLGGESLLLFSSACLALDWAIRNTWVKPFKS